MHPPKPPYLRLRHPQLVIVKAKLGIQVLWRRSARSRRTSTLCTGSASYDGRRRIDNSTRPKQYLSGQLRLTPKGAATYHPESGNERKRSSKQQGSVICCQSCSIVILQHSHLQPLFQYGDHLLRTPPLPPNRQSSQC